MTTPDAQFYDLGGVRCAVTHVTATLPTAPPQAPILYLHGWGVSSELMLPIAERMAKLGYPGIVPDFPGFGRSAVPPMGWSVHDYAQWVVALLDCLGTPTVNIFAHSFGARISLVLGAQQATHISKLALTGAAGIPPKRTGTPSLRLSLYKAVRAGLRSIGAGSLANRLAAWYSQRYGSADYLLTSGVMRETFLKVVNEDLTPFAKLVSRPTLLLWGEGDQDTPLWQGQLLEQLIPDAGLIIYKNGDHYAYLHHQNEVARTLDHFFKN